MCFFSFLELLGGRKEGALYSIRAPREMKFQCCGSLHHAAQQQMPFKHIPVGQKGGTTSSCWPAHLPLFCLHVCMHTHPSLPTPLASEGERKALRWGVWTIPEAAIVGGVPAASSSLAGFWHFWQCRGMADRMSLH